MIYQATETVLLPDGSYAPVGVGMQQWRWISEERKIFECHLSTELEECSGDTLGVYGVAKSLKTGETLVGEYVDGVFYVDGQALIPETDYLMLSCGPDVDDCVEIIPPIPYVSGSNIGEWNG